MDNGTQLPQRKRRQRGAAATAAAAAVAASAAFATGEAGQGSETAKKPRGPEVDVATLLDALQWPHLKQQCFEWGGSFHAALEQVSLAMFGYMTDLDKVQPQASLDCIVSASAKDLLGLVFHLLDELLFKFATDDFIPCDLQVLFLHVPCDAGACYAAPGCEGLATAHQHAALPQSGAGEYRIAIACRGDRFDLSKHPQGTEIKAITYSNMQVHGVRHGTATHTAEEGSGNVTEAAQAGADVAGLAHDEGVHVYVIVDI